MSPETINIMVTGLLTGGFAIAGYWINSFLTAKRDEQAELRRNDREHIATVANVYEEILDHFSIYYAQMLTGRITEEFVRQFANGLRHNMVRLTMIAPREITDFYSQTIIRIFDELNEIAKREQRPELYCERAEF